MLFIKPERPIAPHQRQAAKQGGGGALAAFVWLNDALVSTGYSAREDVVAHIAQARARWGLLSQRDAQPIIDKSMFGSAIRSQILVLLAVVEDADAQQIARALATRHNSAWSAVRLRNSVGHLRAMQPLSHIVRML